MKKNSIKENADSELISRKEALLKMSKYTALTALGTFIILSPQKAQAQSLPITDGDPFGF
jgi:hypothetical protein